VPLDCQFYTDYCIFWHHTPTTLTVPTAWVRYRSTIVLPTLVLVAPVGIAMITDDVEALASVVGAYAGWDIWQD